MCTWELCEHSSESCERPSYWVCHYLHLHTEPMTLTGDCQGHCPSARETVHNGGEAPHFTGGTAG